MDSKHLLKFSQLPPDEKGVGGTRTSASKQTFPILKGMSLYKLILLPNGVREPHWHANADELGYCLKGQVLVSLYNTGDTHAAFLVNEGEAFLIPSGALHHIINVGEGNAELILNFSNEETEDFHLSSTLGMFSDAVLGNTWNVKEKVFHSLKRSLNYPFATLLDHAPKLSSSTNDSSPYHYRLEAEQPLLSNEGGLVRVARTSTWPIATQQALYSLQLSGEGMREPHWHPETAELGYIKKGKGRMSILSPSGNVDTYVMEEGDLYFIPKAYPHHIENLMTDSLEILIFFEPP